MAIQATFIADFRQFESALADAAATLKTFSGRDVDNVQKSLERMTTSFSGEDIIRKAEMMAVAIREVGGATALTENEQKRVNATVTEAIAKYEALERAGKTLSSTEREHLDDLRKLATDTATVAKVSGDAEQAHSKWSIAAGAVASAIGNLAANALANLVANLGQAVGRVFELGGELTDLSNKTGLSTDTLQKLQYAGEQAGVSLETIAKASTRLGINLAGGKDSTVGALQALGLSFDDLRKMTPEQQFYTVAEAIRGVHDPTAQQKIANELLGKSGVELLQVINDEAGGFVEMGKRAEDLGLIMSEDAVGAADALGDAWATMKQQGLVLLGEVLSPFMPLIVGLGNTLVDFARAVMPYVRDGLDLLMRGFLLAKANIAEFIATILDSAEKVPLLGKHLGVAGDAADWFRQQASDARSSLENLNKSHDDANTKVPRLTANLGELDQSQKAAAASAAKHQAELDKLTGQDVLDGAAKIAKNIAEIGGAAQLSEAQAKAVNKQMLEAIDIAEKSGKSVPDLWRDIAFQTGQATVSAGTLTAAMLSLAPAITKTAEETERLAAATLDYIPTNAEMTASILDAMSTVPSVVASGFESAAVQGGQKFSEKVTEWGSGLASTIMNALTGGGNVGDAIGGFIGQGIGSSLASWASGAADSIGGALGGLLGNAANAILPGFGALLGGGLSKIFDTIFKGEERKVNDMRDQFIASSGGLAALNEEAAKAGVTLDALLNAKKTENFQTAMENLKKAIEAHKEALADLDKGLTETFTKGITLTDDLATRMLELFRRDPAGAGESIFSFLQGEIGNVTEGFNTAAAAWSETLTGGVSGFQRFGIAAVAAFEAAKEAGASVPEALAAIRPGLEALIEGMDNLGTGGGTGNAAFDQLLSIATMSEQFEPLLQQVSGLSTMITSLGNVGLLTQETFAALADQVGEAFTAMTAQGANAEDAMRLIQPQLQKLWEAEQQFGVQTEGATAALLDQAFQAGIVGSQFKSAHDQMIDAVNRLVGRMSDLITVMTGGTVSSLAGGAEWAAGRVASSLQGIGVDEPTAEIRALGTAMTDYLPWSAAVGKDGVNAQLGGVSVGPAWNETLNLGTAIREYLPWSAHTGVVGINDAFGRIDVGGVQDAVHDIDWEFERGIPDAADSGVDLVNASMDVAEGAIYTVDTAAGAVSDALAVDIPAATNVAGGAIYDFATEAVDYLGDIEDAATAAAWGRSPTGIKEIGEAAFAVLPAFRVLAQQGLVAFETIEAMSASAARAAAGELTAIPESADRALLEMNMAFDDALGQLADVDVDLVAPFQTMADRIADLANEARARWDTALREATSVPPVDMQAADYAAAEDALRQRFDGSGEAGVNQTINVYLDGRQVASVVAEHLPSVVDAIVGVN